MAMRLGITPTFHLSCRLRLLRLESLCQSTVSYSSLVRLPISKRNLQLHSGSSFPRLGLWRRSVVAITSGPIEDAEVPPQKKRYDLSSGFLQNRRPRETVGLRNSAQEDDDSDDGDEGWENSVRSRAGAGDYKSRDYRFRDSKPSSEEDSDEDWRQDGPESRRQPTTSRGLEDVRNSRGLEDARNSRGPSGLEPRSRGIRSRREEDDEVGDWMGTKEPSKNFKSSSLYTDVKYNQQGARSARYTPLPPPSGVSGNSAKISRAPHERTNPKPRKQPKDSVSSPSEPPRVESDVRIGYDDATASSFMPAVIKPEQPYIYSYTETPKVAPVGFREPVYSPFGPEGVKRPWTGRPPLAKSKKKPREFDSFNPPPQGKKGVKPVQQPGPFPEGEGPKLGRSREEIMGAPLTDAEVKELVMRAQKEDRQLNLGRDGLTHNMLDLIHQHWKRRRVCKIKCKGVPTVDMDNVCNVLEEKSGGKIILRAGGSVFLFRGRNYNYKTRPIIPIMLWKPPTPIYPKLIEKAPAGLTLEEANDLRRLGRRLAPICHLGKNGVYLNLVRDVRNAFRVDDLVKVDCKRMNPSDYKKIGAKLKDLVPCVLLSFEHESILMWKGPKLEADNTDGVEQGNSGEAVKPFRKELPEAGQELLEQTLTQVDSEILASAENSDIEEEGGNEYDDDTDTDESTDHEIESAYQYDNEQESDQEKEEEEHDADIESSYDNKEDDGEGDAEKARKRDERIAERVAEFESRWQEAISSSEVLVLDEHEVDPDTVFAVVKSHFGGAYGAPAQPRNKRNSNELVGKKALKKSSPRLDPSVLDRVPKDPSGLLEIDELAKLLAP
ncbi:hypothetical protein M758_12G021700 [Ceratodon purpureus]|nr:hypothetical protein M758_12G021700 [Ceratodon purpureus]